MIPATFWDALWIARFALAEGLRITAAASVLCISIGFVMGVVFGTLLSFGPWIVRAPIRVYIDMIRGIPILVLILFTFYGLSLLGINVPAFTAGVISLSAFCTAHMAETVRGAIQSVPNGQLEAAKSIGLTFMKTLRCVVLPLAIRRVIPPAVNTAVEIVKGTTLLSTIGVIELLLATQQVIARTYMVLEFYGTALLLYVGFNLILSMLANRLERRFAYLRT